MVLKYFKHVCLSFVFNTPVVNLCFDFSVLSLLAEGVFVTSSCKNELCITNWYRTQVGISGNQQIGEQIVKKMNVEMCRRKPRIYA